MHIKLVAINGRFTHSSLALFHVRNELEKFYPEASNEIVQLTVRDPYYEVLLRLSHNHPEAIFFSASVWNSETVEGLLVDLHDMLPACQLVVGGPQAEVVGRNAGCNVCTVVRGAVEAVEGKFYRDLQNNCLENFYGRSFFHTPNISFASPYKDEDFDTHLKNRNVYYESSRGCPFSCTYCLSSAESGTVHKDLNQVQKELDQILAYDTRVLRFVDRTFNDLPSRALALWKMVLEYDTDTLFHFEIAPDRISEEMFEFLATVPPGRFQFEIGIQSTHMPTLEAIKRKIDPAAAHATVSRLAALNNIHLHADLILGLPYETETSFLKSFADVYAMAPQYIQMGILKLLPETSMSRDAAMYQYKYCKRPPYSVLANQWLDAMSLQKLYWFSECVEKFYNNRYFPSLWSYFRSNKADIGAIFKALLEIATEHRLFELAATQEFLCTLLMKAFSRYKDRSLIRELLVYDWLSCGLRNLPSSLCEPGDNARELQDRLYQDLPLNLPGLYSKKERNRFFKQTVFYRFSTQCLIALGFSTKKPACIAFLHQREHSLMRLQKVALLPL